MKQREEAPVADFTEQYPRFPQDKRGEYLILVPDMLPWHFGLLTSVLKREGYRMEVLKNEGRAVIDEGLKHVHNDTCFPALCVIGQYLDALKSGKYDLDRTAVLITQTGGGCRASNYLSLIRKAMKAEFPQVPVLSLNFSGLERGNGLKMKLSTLLRLAYAIFYGDLIMTCFNQTKPYELQRGACEAVRDDCLAEIGEALAGKGYRKLKRNADRILGAFAAIPVSGGKKIKVGIVGEIYVKYSPLGNSHLEDFLLSEGCEPVVPALMDFILYCVANNLNDAEFYGKRNAATPLFGVAYRFLLHLQKKVIRRMEAQGRYEPLHGFKLLRARADEVLSQGVKMGEGWLIPAEMALLAETGTENIVCAQPFGCLPNHIVGKGAMRTVKTLYPNANIVPVDYDPSATRVNQENRIKLMLANARERAEAQDVPV